MTGTKARQAQKVLGRLGCWKQEQAIEPTLLESGERFLFLVTHAAALAPQGTHTVTMTVRSSCREETGTGQPKGSISATLKGT